MGDMKQPLDKVQWLSSGTRGVGVLVSDTMMFHALRPGQIRPGTWLVLWPGVAAADARDPGRISPDRDG
jgi:orotidine-5'-phosphate decarboxylase